MSGRTWAGLPACACAVAGAFAAVAAATVASGAVYVTTLPSGADVWVDGVYVGRAPVLVDALAAGEHAFTLTKTGWEVREADVTVRAGATVLSSTRLASERPLGAGAASGYVVVRGAAPGAALSVDGVPFTLGAGRSAPLTAGTHTVAATTERGRTSRTFTVLPDTTTQVVLREAPAADVPSAVVAPAEDYLPTDAFSITARKIVVRYAGHVVIAHLGDTAVRYDGVLVSFDSAPQTVAGKLYMPLRLLEKLTDDSSKGTR